MLFYTDKSKDNTTLDPYGKIFISKSKHTIIGLLNEHRYLKGCSIPSSRTSVVTTGHVEQTPNTYNKRKFLITFFHKTYEFDSVTGSVIGFKTYHTHLKTFKTSICHPIPLGKLKVRGFKGSWYKGSKTI